MFTQDSNILITGGGGFIGSAMASRFLKEGIPVTCLDNGEFDRLESWQDNDLLTLVQGDVRDKDLIRSLVSQSTFVFHMAAIVGVDEYLQRPAEVMDVNFLGSKCVLESCLDNGVPVLVTSTSEIYGKNSLPLSEDADRVLGRYDNNRWSYALSKSAMEEIALSLVKKGLQVTIVRYFNVYGPLVDRLGEGRVISKFLGYLRDGKPLPLVDGGHAVRSFCYIDDVVEATYRLAESLATKGETIGQAFNVGRVEPVSMRTLAETMIRLSGQNPGLIDVPGDVFFGKGFEDIPYRVPDVKRLREVTGFQSRVSLEEGLQKSLAFWAILRTDKATNKELDNQTEIPFVKVMLEPNATLLGDIAATLQSSRLTNRGPMVHKFEQKAAGYLGCKETLAVSSGSDALLLSVKALNVGKGKAILPSFTYMATLNAVSNCGLDPVFCDIDQRTWTMDPNQLESLIKSDSDVRLIVPVNVYGVPPDLHRIGEIASKYKIPVLYDNAHGFGTETDKGERLSSEPLVQVFSLHATKVLPAVEGGLVVSSDPWLLKEVRRLSVHGLAEDPLKSTPGFNSKMDELRALVGLHSLSKIQDVLRRRRAYANQIRDFLRNQCNGAFELQVIPENINPNFQNLAVLIPKEQNADSFIKEFKIHGINVRQYFSPPLHWLKNFQKRFDLPVTDNIGTRILCLPIHNRMSDSTIHRLELAAKAVKNKFLS